MLNREIEKLQMRLGGIREMKRLPDILVVVDTRREATAVKEANILNIPVLALLDTNCDPDPIDYILPGNDDAMRSIKLIVGALAEAVIEGKAMRKDIADATEDLSAQEIEMSKYDGSTEEDGDDTRYLGQSTLAKLRDATLFEDEES